MSLGALATSSDVLAGLWPSAPVWVIAVAAGLLTWIAGIVVGLIFRGSTSSGGSGDTAERAAAKTAAPFRVFRVLSGPLSGTLAGGALGFYLGGVYGEFLGFPLAGLGGIIGIGLGSGPDWDYWRATYLAGWVGSWISQVLLFSTRLDLPSRIAVPLGVHGSALGFPVTTLVVGGAIGMLLSGLTTVQQGWTVGFFSGTAASAGALASAVLWLVVVAALLGWALGTPANLVPFLKWATAYSPQRPSDASTAPVLAVEFGAFLSLLLAATLIPRVLTRRTQKTAGEEPDLEFPTQISTIWRVLPGAALGILFAFTGVAALAGETGTYLGTKAALGAALLGGAAVGLVANWVMTRPEAPDSATVPAREQERVAFFQTVGGLLYGIVTGISAWGVLFAGLELGAAHPSPGALVLALGLGVVLALALVLLFVGVDRPESVRGTGRTST